MQGGATNLCLQKFLTGLAESVYFCSTGIRHPSKGKTMNIVACQTHPVLVFWYKVVALFVLIRNSDIISSHASGMASPSNHLTKEHNFPKNSPPPGMSQNISVYKYRCARSVKTFRQLEKWASMRCMCVCLRFDTGELFYCFPVRCAPMFIQWDNLCLSWKCSVFSFWFLQN